jgi:hypothetical protein
MNKKRLEWHRRIVYDSAMQVYIDKVVGIRSPRKIDRTLNHVLYRKEKLKNVDNDFDPRLA